MSAQLKKTNPFEGLSLIKKEDYQGLDVFSLYSKVEALAPSYQEDETKDMFFYLYVINILVAAKIDFLVKGGILLNMYLGEHARRTKDIDVLVKDPDLFFNEASNALMGVSGDITFKTKWIKKRTANENYYHNTFAFTVEAYHNDELINKVDIDGKFKDDYESIEKVKYKGPEVIGEDFYFYGTRIEYIVSEKILAMSSNLTRPVKHLIDLYGLKNIDLDVNLLKEILNKGLIEENQVREKCGVPLLNQGYLIKDGKSFIGSYFLEAIAAGYSLPMDDMIKEVNSWIKTRL